MPEVDHKMRSSFALITTILLVVFLSFYSLNILKTKTLFSNINTHKYLYLQARVHMKKIEDFIKSHTKQQINDFNLTDTRYNMQIVTKNENNKTKYHVSLETVDGTNVRVYKIFEK